MLQGYVTYSFLPKWESTLCLRGVCGSHLSRWHGPSPRRKGTRLARNATWVADCWRGQLQSLLVLAPRYLKLSSSTWGDHAFSLRHAARVGNLLQSWNRARVMLLLDKSWISWGTHGDFTLTMSQEMSIAWSLNEKIWYRVPNQSTMITGQ